MMFLTNHGVTLYLVMEDNFSLFMRQQMFQGYNHPYIIYEKASKKIPPIEYETQVNVFEKYSS